MSRRPPFVKRSARVPELLRLSYSDLPFSPEAIERVVRTLLTGGTVRVEFRDQQEALQHALTLAPEEDWINTTVEGVAVVMRRKAV